MNTMKREKRNRRWHWKLSPPSLEGVNYAIGEEQRAVTNSSRKNEATVPNWKRCSVVGLFCGESKSSMSNSIS